jgi:hypothetical protein
VDKKTITAVAGSAAVTLLVSAFLGYFIGVFERGTDALTNDQIKAVVKEALITDEEKTYAQTLVEINNRLTTMEANQTSMQSALSILIAE